MGDGAESTIGIPRFRLVTESTVYRRQCIADSVSQLVSLVSWAAIAARVWRFGAFAWSFWGDRSKIRGITDVFCKDLISHFFCYLISVNPLNLGGLFIPQTDNQQYL
jgi:hypothetical protein